MAVPMKNFKLYLILFFTLALFVSSTNAMISNGISDDEFEKILRLMDHPESENDTAKQPENNNQAQQKKPTKLTKKNRPKYHKVLVKKHVCETCGKGFQLKNGLINHLRIHTGEKPFKCETCGMAFTQNNNLKRHLRTHSKKI